jgi:anti-sigma factor (TIGR02949 family)
MNCSRARFLLYAYLDRELSRRDAEDLAQHISTCAPCSVRAQSARCLARMLRSRLSRTAAPMRLRERLQNGGPPAVRPRYPLSVLAASVLLLVVPLVADSPARRGLPPVAGSAAVVSPSTLAATSAAAAAPKEDGLSPVSRRLTGTIICLECERRAEAGLCPLPDAVHVPALCADNGEVWRLMSRSPGFAQAASGQTVTLEGVAFPQSGFLRANRAGY